LGQKDDNAITDSKPKGHLAKNRKSQLLLWHRPNNLGKSGKATSDMKKRLDTNRLPESSVVEFA
jgi:hypothetical protein